MKLLSKKIIVRLTIIITILTALYSIAWLTLMYQSSRKINYFYADRSLELNVTGKNHSLYSFSKITFTGFPFALSFKLQNFTEENGKNIVKFSKPVLIGYNLFKRQFFLEYQGESLVYSNPLVSNNHSFKIQGKVAYYIHHPITKSLILSFVSYKVPLNVLHNIDEIRITNDGLKLFDENNNLLSVVNKLNIRLNAKTQYSYKTLASLLSFIPPQISSKIEIDILNLPNQVTSSLCTFSYPMISLMQEISKFIPQDKHQNISLIAVDLSSLLNQINEQKKNTPKLHNLLKNLKLNLKIQGNTSINDSKASTYNGNSYFSITQNQKEDEHNIEFLADGEVQSKYINWYLTCAKNLIKAEDIGILKAPQEKFNILDELKFFDIISEILKPFNHQQESISCSFKSDIKGQSKKGKLNVNINELGALINNVGFNLTNTTEVNTPFSLTTSGTISLLNMPNLVQAVITGWNMKTDSVNIEEVQKKCTDLLYQISNSPEARDKDIFIDYKLINSNKKGLEGNIGTRTWNEFYKDLEQIGKIKCDGKSYEPSKCINSSKQSVSKDQP